jgi:thioredoxin 1
MIRQIKTVTDFDAFIESAGVVVAHFGMNFNSFDRTMQRNLIELKAEFPARVEFATIDIDSNETIKLAARINLVNTPTLVFYLNGEQKETLVGMRTMDDIRARILSLLDAK